MHRRRRRPLRADLPPEFVASDHRMRIMVGTLVLNNHPEGISIEDLRYELSEDERDLSVDMAIAGLIANGLLHRQGQMIRLAFVPPGARVTPVLVIRRRRRRCPCIPRLRGDHD
jgi:hypothetical protein